MLNLAQLVVNKPMNSIYKKNNQYSFFCSIYHCLMQKLQELITKELHNFTEILISVKSD